MADFPVSPVPFFLFVFDCNWSDLFRLFDWASVSTAIKSYMCQYNFVLGFTV